MLTDVSPPEEVLAEELEGLDLTPTRFTATGQLFLMGEMKGVVAALPVRDIVGLSLDEVLTRRDYELDGEEAGNRHISPAHVKKIKNGLGKHAKKLLTGCFTFAIAPEGVLVKELAAVNEHAKIVQFSVRSGYEIFIVDGQHRNDGLRALWRETLEAVDRGALDAEDVARLLGVSSVPVLILFEQEKDEVSRMFVTMASTKPISPSLIAVMDREQFANRLGLEVAHKSELLAAAERLAFQTSTATKEKLYAAAPVRAAAANVFIGFRDRTPDMRESNLRAVFEDHGKDTDADETVSEAAAEVVESLDYAYGRIPGWRELKEATLEPKDFRATYVHGTAGGLYVIAGVVCAARLSPGVDPKHVIDLLADHISWAKEERTQGQDSALLVHPDFEGTLVVNEPVVDDDGEIVGFETKTGGGARTNYEKATRRVIDKLIGIEPELEEMRSDTVQVAMGLKASGKRGRPPKS